MDKTTKVYVNIALDKLTGVDDEKFLFEGVFRCVCVCVENASC